jgi:hypothetical protein
MNTPLCISHSEFIISQGIQQSRRSKTSLSVTLKTEQFGLEFLEVLMESRC